MKRANVDFEQVGTAFRLCGLHVWKLGGLVAKAQGGFANDVCKR